MNTDSCPSRRRGRSRRAIGGVVLAASLLLAACSGGGDGAPDEVGDDRTGANPGPLPTLAGGIELDPVDPAAMFVGADLAYGSPLPSEQAAADAFTADPEVRAATARRVYEASTGRPLADAVVLTLDGAELFDDDVLRAFQEALVSVLGGGDASSRDLAGRRVLHAAGPPGTVFALREGDALAVVSAPDAADAELVTTRLVEARARGEVGPAEPRTPLVPRPAEAAFVPVPTIAFTPFSPPEEEPPPEPPALAGATSVVGRYGVVAGERRTVVWSIAVDPAVHPTAEALDPALRDLATGRAGGAPLETVEVTDRLVQKAIAPVGERSAHVFRHGGLVLVVEGLDPAQLDAVTTAWIAALGPS